MQIEFRYGALCDALEKQANDQGFTLDKDAEKLEKQREAILTLTFGSILTDSQINKAYQKLHKQTVKSLKPLEVENE